MTVETDYDPEVYAGDGSTTFFAVGWEFIEETTLVVQLVLTDGVTVVDQVLNSDYTVDGGNGDKGSITMTVPPATGEQLVISRFNPRKQLLDLETNQDLPAESLEQAYDRGTLVDQEITSDEARNLKLAITTTIPDAIFPDPVADYAVFGKADESGWDNRPITDFGQISIPIPISQGGTNATDAATARANLGAAALSDIVGKNRIINGVAPFVNQRGNQVGLTSGQFFVDRWAYDKNDPTGVVDGGIATIGGDWISINVTTANASPAADVQHVIRQPIEANNIVDFGLGGTNAATVTLSFEHRHAKTGTYCVAFRNAANDRCYVAEYTQDASDTPEWATVTLTLDTTGTWATGTSRGLDVIFTIAGESAWQTGTPNTWVDGNFLATANQVNGVDSTDNFFRIRDVQLVLGTVASAPEWIEYSQKEQQCFYYFERLKLDTQSNEVMANGHAETTSTARIVIQYAPKRTGLVSPTATNQNTFQLSYKATTANGAAGTVTFDNKGRRAMRMTLTVSNAVLTAGESVILQRNGTVDCHIDVDDELI